MRVPGGPREESSIPEKEREDSQGQAKFRMIGKEKKKFKVEVYLCERTENNIFKLKIII